MPVPMAQQGMHCRVDVAVIDEYQMQAVCRGWQSFHNIEQQVVLHLNMDIPIYHCHA